MLFQLKNSLHMSVMRLMLFKLKFSIKKKEKKVRTIHRLSCNLLSL
jgi:hypothetical protein